MVDARTGFRPDIEGLRAVAVILVVLNHLLTVPAGGFIGVDLFFVISGFVITGLLWRQSSTRTFAFRSFVTRRVRRLLPSALLVLLVTNLAVQYLFVGPRVQQTRTDTGWALALLANVRMASVGTDYFHASDAPSVIQHYWSLAVEEQFYLVWPALLVLLVLLARRRVGARLVLPVALTLTAASFLYALHLVATDPVAAYFSAPARAWELGAGAVLALVVAWGLQLPGWLQHASAWVGVGLLVTASLYIDPTLPFPGVSALLPVGAGLALILAGVGSSTPAVTRLLSHPVARYIGQISYPIYLWHWPVIVISEQVWGRNPLVWVGAPFVSVLLAMATHHLVEEPLRGRVRPRDAYRALIPALRGTGFHRWAPAKNLALGALSWVLVLAALAATTTPPAAPSFVPADSSVVASGSDGSGLPTPTGSPAQTQLSERIDAALRLTRWPARLDPPLDQLDRAGAPEWLQDNCLQVNPDNVTRCRYGRHDARHHAVVLGDSIAASYLPGLRAALEPLGWDFQLLTMAACNNAVTVLFKGRAYRECDRHREWAISRIREMRPDLVVLANITNIASIAPDALRGTRLETWQRGLARTLARIRPVARQMLVLSPPPGTANLQTCLTRSSIPADCMRVVRRDWDTMAAAEENASRQARVRFVRTDTWFCRYGYCPAVIGTIPVTIDGIHLTAAYSRSLAPMFTEVLASLGIR